MQETLAGKTIRFIMVLAIAMGVSALLFTIEWFTWGSWIFVSLLLVWKFYLINADAQNKVVLWRELYIKLGNINDTIEKASTRLSTKRNYRKRKMIKNREQLS